MGHHITAIVLKGKYNDNVAKEFDLFAVRLIDELTLFHIDLYYTEFWQEKLNVQGYLEINKIDDLLQPNEKVILTLLQNITSCDAPEFALIATDYHGGQGFQSASVFKGDVNMDSTIKTINLALKYLGVKRTSEHDEFECVGLQNIRYQPEYLEKYFG
ncbi:hypothetical protein [Empedobacter sedimenti]|uniref:hypothetical protein n=1 Tax=Empedobacter sedimenti TaxID=3042610 RepID=UPI0024A6BB43|nr:hypothetical protein [Empedobacter sedimenti]